MSSPAPEFEKKFLNMMDAGALYAEKTIFGGANDPLSPVFELKIEMYLLFGMTKKRHQRHFLAKKCE